MQRCKDKFKAADVTRGQRYKHFRKSLSRIFIPFRTLPAINQEHLYLMLTTRDQPQYTSPIYLPGQMPSLLPPLRPSMSGRVPQLPRPISCLESMSQYSRSLEPPVVGTVGISSTPYLPPSGLPSPPIYSASSESPVPLPCIATSNLKSGTGASSASCVPPASKRKAEASDPSASARRKRTHSETERRRRERVNERFDELKELVPACRGTQFARRGGELGLHKLDILTEAVHYVRDLEKQLQAAKRANATRINFLVN